MSGLERLLDEVGRCAGAEELWKLVSERVDALLGPESLVAYAREGQAFNPRFSRGSAELAALRGGFAPRCARWNVADCRSPRTRASSIRSTAPRSRRSASRWSCRSAHTRAVGIRLSRAASAQATSTRARRRRTSQRSQRAAPTSCGRAGTGRRDSARLPARWRVVDALERREGDPPARHAGAELPGGAVARAGPRVRGDRPGRSDPRAARSQRHDPELRLLEASETPVRFSTLRRARPIASA